MERNLFFIYIFHCRLTTNGLKLTWHKSLNVFHSFAAKLLPRLFIVLISLKCINYYQSRDMAVTSCKARRYMLHVHSFRMKSLKMAAVWQRGFGTEIHQLTQFAWHWTNCSATRPAAEIHFHLFTSWWLPLHFQVTLCSDFEFGPIPTCFNGSWWFHTERNANKMLWSQRSKCVCITEGSRNKPAIIQSPQASSINNHFTIFSKWQKQLMKNKTFLDDPSCWWFVTAGSDCQSQAVSPHRGLLNDWTRFSCGDETVSKVSKEKVHESINIRSELCSYVTWSICPAESLH